MKKLSALAASLLLAGSLSAFAVELKTDTFQVTGEVTKIDADSITVMKGKERFHITKDAATKVTGDLKVGEKVTVQYQMYAKDIEVKAGKSAKAAKSPKKK